MDKQLLTTLIDTPSLSGNEIELQKKLIKHMEHRCDKIITDHAGNTIFVHNPESKVKILLDAHIDEIGLVITSINPDGRCKMSNVGSIRPSLYLGSQVQVITKKGIVNGVIAQYRPIQNDKINVSELELDLGTFSKEETLNLVEIGDYVVRREGLLELQNNNYAARAMDDKIGVYAILKALEMSIENKLPNGVYASSTVGEETTANGATFLPNLINPTCAIIVDVITDTSSLPSLNNRCELKLGHGPVLSIGTVMNKKLIEITKKVAKENNIPLQFDTTGDRTYTNTDEIHFQGKGVPSILLNIPLRYMHSSAEVINMDDINNLSKLIYLIIKEINEDTSFLPF